MRKCDANTVKIRAKPPRVRSANLFRKEGAQDKHTYYQAYLRASDVAKELDVKAVAVAPTAGFAGFDDPTGALARGRYDAFGHEKDLLGKQALELGEK